MVTRSAASPIEEDGVVLPSVPPAALAAVRRLCRAAQESDAAGSVRRCVRRLEPRGRGGRPHRPPGRRLARCGSRRRSRRRFRATTDLVGRTRTERVDLSADPAGAEEPSPTAGSPAFFACSKCGGRRVLDAGAHAELARAFAVPTCSSSIIDADRRCFQSHVGLPDDLAAAGEAPHDASICGHMIAGPGWSVRSEGRFIRRVGSRRSAFLVRARRRPLSCAGDPHCAAESSHAGREASSCSL